MLFVEQAELSASESERVRLADALAAGVRQVESAVNQLREAQAAADRSEERARRAEQAVEQVTIPEAGWQSSGKMSLFKKRIPCLTGTTADEDKSSGSTIIRPCLLCPCMSRPSVTRWHCVYPGIWSAEQKYPANARQRG